MLPTIIEVFRPTGAYLSGHFRLTSGLHSNQYLQCARVLQFPAFAERMGRALAVQLAPPAESGGGACSLVAAPALGGLIIGHEVARAIGCRFIFTEPDTSGKMVLGRGFSAEPGETAVVVEDVVTTGGSTREVIDVLQAAEVRVLAAGSIIDCSGGTGCRHGVPVEKPGSRLTV
jgi:orotate phosphoribosyltransferase